MRSARLAQLDGHLGRVERGGEPFGDGEAADPPADDDDSARHGPPTAAITRRARADITPLSSLTTEVRRKISQAPCRSPMAGLDVEVVEHLEVVGDETARADQDAVDVGRCAERVDDAEQVGLQPRIGGTPGGLPGDRPAVVGEPDAVGDERRSGGDLRRVWIGGVEDSAGERVGGEHDRRVRAGRSGWASDASTSPAR